MINKETHNQLLLQSNESKQSCLRTIAYQNLFHKNVQSLAQPTDHWKSHLHPWLSVSLANFFLTFKAAYDTPPGNPCLLFSNVKSGLSHKVVQSRHVYIVKENGHISFAIFSRIVLRLVVSNFQSFLHLLYASH